MWTRLVVLCIVPVCRATSWIVPLLHRSRALLTQPTPSILHPVPAQLPRPIHFICRSLFRPVLLFSWFADCSLTMPCVRTVRARPLLSQLSATVPPTAPASTPLSAASLLCTRARRRGLDLSWFHSFDPECVSVLGPRAALIRAGSVRVLHCRFSTTSCAYSPSLQVLPDAWSLRLR